MLGSCIIIPALTNGSIRVVIPPTQSNPSPKSFPGSIMGPKKNCPVVLGTGKLVIMRLEPMSPEAVMQAGMPVAFGFASQ